MSGTTEDPDQRSRWQRICDILDAVLDAPADQRDRILDMHCGSDAVLRAEVDALLMGECGGDDRIDSPAADWAVDLLEEGSPASAYAEGDIIGPYRLIRELGRGGMGTVWLAERADGEFEQKVALKLLKRGVDTDAVLARFREERRILARLKHPHIALFLDGGVSAQGQPWFSMEWVDGESISRWCDGRKLDIRDRVRMFLDVIAAVQYAHQQLVVHRDLKPGNVLVDQDGGVKLLDFGIAKMLDVTQGSAAPATMTRLGWRMLTPEYAAPEQLQGQPVTTATDVYALGVLLCELLSGRRPRQRPANADDELVARPSSLVDQVAAGLRSSTVDRVRRQLRGDLDTITLKALSSEPARRYGSAQALGEDLQRWLDGEPVQARPDSRWYRMRRFVGRNRLGVTAAVVVLLSLATGVLLAAWQAQEASRQAQEAKRQAQEARRQTLEAERQTARAEQVQDFLVGIFQASKPSEWKGKEPTAKDLLEFGEQRLDADLKDDPRLHAQMQAVIGEIAMTRGDSARAEALLEKSLARTRQLSGATSKDYADVLHPWADLLYSKGDVDGAMLAVQQELAIRSKFKKDPGVAQALGMMSSLQYSAGNVDEAIALRRRAMSEQQERSGKQDRFYLAHQLSLGQMLVRARRLDEAEELLGNSLFLSRRLYGPDSARYASAMNGYAVLLGEKGELDRAARGYQEAADVFRKAGNDQELLGALINQAELLCRVGKFASAERIYGEATQVQSRTPFKLKAGLLERNLGKCLSDAGLFSKAEPLLKGASGLRPWSGERGTAANALGGASHLLRLFARQGKMSEASNVIRQVEEAYGPVRSKDGPLAAVFLVLAAPVMFANGDHSGAIETLEDAISDLHKANASEKTVSSAILDLANLELQDGQATQAESSLRGIERSLDGGRGGPTSLRARMLRGAALMQMGRLSEAESILRDVLSERSAMYGGDNVWSGEARLYLGICLLRAGKSREGRALIETGRAEFTKSSGVDHFVVRLADEAVRSKHS